MGILFVVCFLYLFAVIALALFGLVGMFVFSDCGAEDSDYRRCKIMLRFCLVPPVALSKLIKMSKEIANDED